MKLNRKIQKSTICANCSRSNFETGSKMSVCSKCNITYCSRMCQTAHWPKHKSMCKVIVAERKMLDRVMDSEETNIRLLLQKWCEKATLFFLSAIMYALTTDELKQQPPTKVVTINLEFNYNLRTFLLVDEPKAVATSEYSSHDGMKSIIDRLYMRFEDSNKKIRSEQVYHQFALINCIEFQGKYVADYVHGFYESQLDVKKEKGLLDISSVDNLCRHVKLNSHLFQGWDALRASNFQRQIDFMKSSPAYLRFAQNALQLFCKKPRHMTHGLVLRIKLGKEIGEIAELVEYDVASLPAIRKLTEVRVKSTKKQQLVVSNEIDILKSPKLLKARQHNPKNIMMVICFMDTETATAFIADSEVCELPLVRKGSKVKTCNRDAKKYFKQLQGMVKEVPSELVEKVSL